MASMNSVTLLGNLTRDPELRYTPQGTAVVTFGLAVNRRYQQEGQQRGVGLTKPEWHAKSRKTLSGWRKRAQHLQPTCTAAATPLHQAI